MAVNRGSPRSPAIRMPPPRIRAATMICSILPSASAATGLEGTMFSNVAVTSGDSASSAEEGGAVRPMPRPTGNRLAASSPTVTATAVVSR